MLIAHSISTSHATTARDIEIAARETGYCVTVEQCDRFEKVQFLKHSPVLDVEGFYKPLLNLGVILRLTGRCKRDLPASKGQSIEHRARQFQQGLLRGSMPRVNHPLASAMRSAAGLEPITTDKHKPLTDPKILDQLGYTYQHEGDSDIHTFDEEIFERYRNSTDPEAGITDHEIAELIELYAHAGTGDMVSCAAADKILHLDYGLRCPNGIAST